MVLRELPLCDGDEARKPRLGGEEVVETRVESVLGAIAETTVR